mmetsp:Transcript_5365/g.22729  ORF Transcript_5365/g.22729 Transcript_5365/m.22729 type:complete len:332 (+) Transcript_5365:1086-2081(+)
MSATTALQRFSRASRAPCWSRRPTAVCPSPTRARCPLSASPTQRTSTSLWRSCRAPRAVARDWPSTTPWSRHSRPRGLRWTASSPPGATGPCATPRAGRASGSAIERSSRPRGPAAPPAPTWSRRCPATSPPAQHRPLQSLSRPFHPTPPPRRARLRTRCHRQTLRPAGPRTALCPSGETGQPAQWSAAGACASAAGASSCPSPATAPLAASSPRRSRATRSHAFPSSARLQAARLLPPGWASPPPPPPRSGRPSPGSQTDSTQEVLTAPGTSRRPRARCSAWSWIGSVWRLTKAARMRSPSVTTPGAQATRRSSADTTPLRRTGRRRPTA